MNIIERLQSILEEFPGISELHVDFTESEPTSFGLSSLGDSLVFEDVLGNQTRRHSFMLYLTYSGYNDYERLCNSGVLLELCQWLPDQVGSEVESSGKSGIITEITCENGMLYSVPQENTLDGVQYQMQINAVYKIGG